MPWRYQPVFIEEDGDRSYGLIEVYFDKDGRLEAWSESVGIYPGGGDMDDLKGDLAHMMVDAYSWVPVRFSDLKPGIVLQALIPMEERKDVADMVDRSFGALAQRANHTPQ